jgi:glycosyltransferase involved in cell wall biosynthesis
VINLTLAEKFRQLMKDELVNQKLAIVIPAFKGDFLAKALACLVRQTDQRFTIYVCDDASSADIQGIAGSALGARPYIFKRFEKNLGSVSLARHWDRCVALSNEPWVWLFSDDDLMDDSCVAAFYKFLESDGETADILRFDAWIIDEQDKITGLHTLHRDSETWLEFAYGLLMGWRRSFMQQMVFRRSAYERTGGFLDLPLAWSTDDAAVIAMGRQKAIRRIPSSRIHWRNSDKNITPDRSFTKRKKTLQAVCLFLEWLQGQLQTPREHLFENDHAAFLRALDRYLVEQILIQGALPAMANWSLLSRTRSQIGKGSRFALLRYITVAAVNDGISAIGQAAKKLAGRSGK